MLNTPNPTHSDINNTYKQVEHLLEKAHLLVQHITQEEGPTDLPRLRVAVPQRLLHGLACTGTLTARPFISPLPGPERGDCRGGGW